jgi:hypothetical protein
LLSGDGLGRSIIAALWAGLLVDQLADNTLFSISTSAALWLLLAFVVVPVPMSAPSALVQRSPANGESKP